MADVADPSAAGEVVGSKDRAQGQARSPWRWWLLVGAVLAAGFVALAVLVSLRGRGLALSSNDQNFTPTTEVGSALGVDVRFQAWLEASPLGGHLRPARLVAALGGPVAMAVVMVVLVAGSWRAGDRRRAKFAGLAPLLAALCGVAAKPLVGRQVGFSFGLPSGHVTAAAALAATVVIVSFDLVAPRADRRPLRIRWPGRAGPPGAGPVTGRPGSTGLTGLTGAAVLAAAVLAPVAVAVAVVLLRWHLVTDSIAGLLMGLGMVALMAAFAARWIPVERPMVARRLRRRLGYVIVAAAAVLVGAIHLPYLVLTPGGLISLNAAVSVPPATGAVEEGAEPTALSGIYSGLTVRATNLTMAGWFRHNLGDSLDPIVARDLVIPPNKDGAEFYEEQRGAFVDAGQVAVAVAERALGHNVIISGDGALVTAVQPGAPAQGHLQVGDVITTVDGASIATDTDLRTALAKVAETATQTATGTATAELRVRAQSGATRSETVELRLLGATGRLGLGVGIATANLRFELPIDVEVDGGGVGGPSAGLLTALTVYDLLSPEDLAAGRHITGTGTLALGGQVGEIGGIVQKLHAAIAADADVFLAPAPQADLVTWVAAGRIKVVGVATFDEALAALQAR